MLEIPVITVHIPTNTNKLRAAARCRQIFLSRCQLFHYRLMSKKSSYLELSEDFFKGRSHHGVIATGRQRDGVRLLIHDASAERKTLPRSPDAFVRVKRSLVTAIILDFAPRL